MDIDDNYSDEDLKSENEENNVNVQKLKYGCRDCGKTFRLESCLKTHSLKHRKSLTCEVCGKEFKRKLNYIYYSWILLFISYYIYSC